MTAKQPDDAAANARAAARGQMARLWNEHLAAPFPVCLYGQDADGTDFTLIDANIAGCVHTLLTIGSLDGKSKSILAVSLDKLSAALPALTDEEAAAYFQRLRDMGRLAASDPR